MGVVVAIEVVVVEEVATIELLSMVVVSVLDATRGSVGKGFVEVASTFSITGGVVDASGSATCARIGEGNTSTSAIRNEMLPRNIVFVFMFN